MDNNILIRKYLHGELTHEQLLQFLKELKINRELADQVKLHRAMREHRLDELKDYLLSSEADLFPNPKSRNKAIIINLRYVVTFIFLVVIFYFLYHGLTSKPNTDNFLEIAYSEPYISPGTLQGIDNDENDWKNAIISYSQENYEDAAIYISRIDSINIVQQLYLGLSKMYQKQPEFQESISIFETIKNHPDNFHQDATLWYLSIAYMKVGKNNFAKLILKDIALGNHYKSDQAIKLLEYIASR